MAGKKHNPYEALERTFHEPNRLAILSAISSARNGKTFNELKEECALTDGNLSRHLKTLEEAGVVGIKKEFVDSKPRTTAAMTPAGQEQFISYLEALETVLAKAADARKVLKKTKKESGLASGRLPQEG